MALPRPVAASGKGPPGFHFPEGPAEALAAAEFSFSFCSVLPGSHALNSCGSQPTAGKGPVQALCLRTCFLGTGPRREAEKREGKGGRVTDAERPHRRGSSRSRTVLGSTSRKRPYKGLLPVYFWENSMWWNHTPASSKGPVTLSVGLPPHARPDTGESVE